MKTHYHICSGLSKKQREGLAAGWAQKVCTRGLKTQAPPVPSHPAFRLLTTCPAHHKPNHGKFWLLLQDLEVLFPPPQLFSGPSKSNLCQSAQQSNSCRRPGRRHLSSTWDLVAFDIKCILYQIATLWTLVFQSSTQIPFLWMLSSKIVGSYLQEMEFFKKLPIHKCYQKPSSIATYQQVIIASPLISLCCNSSGLWTLLPLEGSN